MHTADKKTTSMLRIDVIPNPSFASRGMSPFVSTMIRGFLAQLWEEAGLVATMIGSNYPI